MQTEYEKILATRLAHLRGKRNISARDMSISMGQNVSYINAIENAKALPSMTSFFNICDHLEVTPKEFFDEDNNNPYQLNKLIEKLMALDDEGRAALLTFMESLQETE